MKLILTLTLAIQLGAGPQAVAGPKTHSGHLDRIRSELFSHMARLSMTVSNLEEYEKVFLPGLKAEDRAALVSHLKKIKYFPTFSTDGKTLVLDDDIHTVKIEWPDLAKFEFVINGTRWTYDPLRPLMDQAQDLQRRFKPIKSAWRPRILPEAEAEPITISGVALMGLGALIGTAVGFVFTDLLLPPWCWLTGSSFERCINWRKAKDQEALKGAPSLDGVFNQVDSDQRNVLTRWEHQGEIECPDRNDGKPKEYRAQIRTIEVADGKKRATSAWFNALVKFNTRGIPTDMIVSREATDPAKLDPKSEEAGHQLAVHITFDADSKKPISYRVPNPNYDPNSWGSSPTHALTQTMKLDPPQANIITRSKDAIVFVNYLATKCVMERVIAAAKVGIDPGSPAKPKEDAKTTN